MRLVAVTTNPVKRVNMPLGLLSRKNPLRQSPTSLRTRMSPPVAIRSLVVDVHRVLVAPAHVAPGPVSPSPPVGPVRRHHEVLEQLPLEAQQELVRVGALEPGIHLSPRRVGHDEARRVEAARGEVPCPVPHRTQEEGLEELTRSRSRGGIARSGPGGSPSPSAVSFSMRPTRGGDAVPCEQAVVAGSCPGVLAVRVQDRIRLEQGAAVVVAKPGVEGQPGAQPRRNRRRRSRRPASRRRSGRAGGSSHSPAGFRSSRRLDVVVVALDGLQPPR